MGEVEVLLFPTDSVTCDVKSPLDQEVTGSGLVDSSTGAPSGDEVPSYDPQHLEDEDPETNVVAGTKKKGCRRKKRRYKPYYKLSWQERRELEEREARRANRFRARMFAHGQPVAPYNTTQFLMEDHNVQEPDYEHITNGHHRHRDNSLNSVDSSEEYYSSPEDEEDFLQKQFSEVYDDIHAERLNSMSKAELVQEYLVLEDRVEILETQLKEAKANAEKEKMDGESQTSPEAKEELLEKISIFKEEIRRLMEENKRLRLENETLREVVSSGSVSS